MSDIYRQKKANAPRALNQTWLDSGKSKAPPSSRTVQPRTKIRIMLKILQYHIFLLRRRTNYIRCVYLLLKRRVAQVYCSRVEERVVQRHGKVRYAGQQHGVVHHSGRWHQRNLRQTSRRQPLTLQHRPSFQRRLGRLDRHRSGELLQMSACCALQRMQPSDSLACCCKKC